MPSSFSTNLKIELMATGEASGVWGQRTNTNLGTAIEEAIVGRSTVNFTTDANLTLTLTNSNESQAARAFVLNVTSGVSLTTTRELVVPTINKTYVVQNNTTGGQSITVKTTAGTGITVPNGGKAYLYVDGTNVITTIDTISANSTTPALRITQTGTGAALLVEDEASDSTPFVVDASGNVGVGTVPSAATLPTLFFGGVGSATAGNNSSLFLGNAWIDGADVRYRTTKFATQYEQDNLNGVHRWYNAPSGTAGNVATFTERMTLDFSGNLGLGVVPSAWTTLKSIELPRGCFIASLDSAVDFYMGANAYLNGPSWRYHDSVSSATLYRQSGGQHIWFTAGAGTAGNAISFTQAMTLDASGNLGIGTTSPNARLAFGESSAIAFNTSLGGTGTYASIRAFNVLAPTNPATNIRFIRDVAAVGNDGAICFDTTNVERARIDSSGNLLVGTTSAGSYMPRARLIASGSQYALETQSNTVGYYSHICTNTAAAGDNLFTYFGTEANGATQRGSIDYNRGGGLTRYNTTSDQTLKNIIGDAPQQKSLDILADTRLREYSWKDDATDKPQIGVIAQEVHEVFPGAVSVGGEYTETDAEGNEVTKYRPWAVDKTAWTFHLIAGYQHLKAENDALKSALESLTARVAALESA